MAYTSQSPLAPLVELVERSRQALDSWLPARSYLPGDILATEIRPLTDEALDAWRLMLARIERARGEVGEIQIRTEFTAEARNQQIAAAVERARSEVDRQVSAIQDRAARVIAILAPIGRPPKPNMDAGTVAQLEAMKSDLRLVLDGLQPADVAARMRDFLADAIANADTLTVYLLAGDKWPSLYLESRGEAPAMYEQLAADTYGATASESVERARGVLRLMEGRNGLAAVATAAQHYARLAFDDIARIRA